jgi:hypothetical protein
MENIIRQVKKKDLYKLNESSMTYDLCDFIASHQWLTLQELKDGEVETLNTNELI